MPVRRPYQHIEIGLFESRGAVSVQNYIHFELLSYRPDHIAPVRLIGPSAVSPGLIQLAPALQASTSASRNPSDRANASPGYARSASTSPIADPCAGNLRKVPGYMIVA
jgi:hypothetical protein